MKETPTFVDAGHAHTIYGLSNLTSGTAVAGTANFGTALPQQFYLNQQVTGPDPAMLVPRGMLQADYQREHKFIQGHMTRATEILHGSTSKEEKVSRRLVQVFIADPNENVPLDDSLLYRGNQHLTDLTDQELFYELDIKSILEDHNKKRIKFIDKKVKERVEHLEPVKIRELKMIVVTVATF